MFHLKCPWYVTIGEDPGQIPGTANLETWHLNHTNYLKLWWRKVKRFHFWLIAPYRIIVCFFFFKWVNRVSITQKIKLFWMSKKSFNKRYLKEISSLGIRSSSYLVLSDINNLLKAVFFFYGLKSGWELEERISEDHNRARKSRNWKQLEIGRVVIRISPVLFWWEEKVDQMYVGLKQHWFFF